MSAFCRFLRNLQKFAYSTIRSTICLVFSGLRSLPFSSLCSSSGACSQTLLRSHSFHENVITASGVRTSSPVQVRHQGKAGCHNQLSDRFLAPQNSRSSTGFMTPGKASPITSTQLGGLASRRYFLMHIPMKHTPTLGHSASFLDSVCVCASHNTPLPQFLPLFFPPCQGSMFGSVSYTPTFHVSWLRPLGTSSKWSLAQSPFSCSTLYLSWRVGNLNMDTLSVISVEHDIQKYFCRTGRQHSPLSDLLADSKNAPSLAAEMGTWARGLPSAPVRRSSQVAPPALRPLLDTWRCVTIQHRLRGSWRRVRVQRRQCVCNRPWLLWSRGDRWQWRASPVALSWWPAGPSWRQVWF